MRKKKNFFFRCNEKPPGRDIKAGNPKILIAGRFFMKHFCFRPDAPGARRTEHLGPRRNPHNWPMRQLSMTALFPPSIPTPYATICWKSGSASWTGSRPKPCFSRRIPSWKKTAGRTRVPPHKDNNKIPFRAMQEGGNRYTFGCRPLVL